METVDKVEWRGKFCPLGMFIACHIGIQNLLKWGKGVKAQGALKGLLTCVICLEMIPFQDNVRISRSKQGNSCLRFSSSENIWRQEIRLVLFKHLLMYLFVCPSWQPVWCLLWLSFATIFQKKFNAWTGFPITNNAM